MSADSGLATFRDSGGLWEGHDIEDVATVRGWERDPEAVLTFYNKRRKQAFQATPNSGHIALAELEAHARLDEEVHVYVFAEVLQTVKQCLDIPRH